MSNEAISSLISTVLPIVITLLFAWLSSRNEQAKRRQICEDAKQRIELISAYVTSQSLVVEDPNELGALKKTAAAELYDIKTFLDERLQNMEKSSEKSENYFQRFFLLYKMRTGLASFLRFCFFIVLIISVLWSLFMSSIAFGPDMAQDGGLGVAIFVLALFILPPVLAAFMLRWLAVKFDKPAQTMQMAEAVQ